MAQLVADCPRCGSRKTTFDTRSQNYTYEKHGWQDHYEVFSVCRHCGKGTVFVLGVSQFEYVTTVKNGGLIKEGNSANDFADVAGFISIKDSLSIAPPEHLPEDIAGAFTEGATCLGVACYNAAAAMFRRCIDLATGPLLPAEDESLNRKTRRDLGLRLPWMFDKGLLPAGLRELASCVKEDGNDGAHAGNLGKPDAEDLLDFAYAFLERLYTEPKRLELAQERREKRRKVS
ncbi:MAG: hypothetical protein QOD12_1203 [Verrucomicrobiota bacterium]|jgi:hypothetical protein